MEMLVEVLGLRGGVIPSTTISVVVLGMVVLAVVDVWRREVEDYAVLVLLGVAAIGMHIEGITTQQWLGSALTAAIAFLVYLNLGQRGILGGGDVKLSIVPAFVLGAVSPVIGIWWIAGAMLIHQGVFFLVAWTHKSREAIPHVPAMAAAAIAATYAFPAHI